MSTDLTLWAIDVLRRFAPSGLDTGPAPRQYAPEPAADYEVECFKRQCARDAAAREAQADREEDARHEACDAEMYFLEQQCPADSNFR